jgi:hypothetical protein
VPNALWTPTCGHVAKKYLWTCQRPLGKTKGIEKGLKIQEEEATHESGEHRLCSTEKRNRPLLSFVDCGGPSSM